MPLFVKLLSVFFMSFLYVKFFYLIDWFSKYSSKYFSKIHALFQCQHTNNSFFTPLDQYRLFFVSSGKLHVAYFPFSQSIGLFFFILNFFKQIYFQMLTFDFLIFFFFFFKPMRDAVRLKFHFCWKHFAYCLLMTSVTYFYRAIS